MNTSPTKQEYSFPKSKRFTYKIASNDFFYTLPSTLTRRGAGLGYGKRTDLAHNRKESPAPTAYCLPSAFESRRGFTFGRSREDCKGLSLKELFVSDPKVPGPGAYDVTSKEPAGPKWSLKARRTRGE